MTAALAAATADGLPVSLLAAYEAHVEGLACGQQAKRLRRRAARDFVAAHPDISVWMRRPTPARLADINRIDAWPFLTWCFLEDVARADVDLLGAYNKGGHFNAWARARAGDVARSSEVGRRLGWGDNWVHQVCGEGLAFVCLVTGKRIGDLTDADFDAFLDELDQAPTITSNHRKVVRSRIYGARLVCYHLGITDSHPKMAWQKEITLSDRVAAIAQPEMRGAALRYLEVVSTTLRPSTVRGRADSLVLLCGWLAEHHPGLRSFAALRREHVEAFLVWNRTGRRRRRVRNIDRPLSVVHLAHVLVDLKAFFDDIAIWGWADRPATAVLFRGDIPNLPTPMPRALAPDTDRDLMAAVGNLDDVFAKCGITILRGTGMRLGELMDLELDCLWDIPGHGTWVKVPLGKLNNERVVPLDEPTLTAFDDWMAQRGPHRALPHPRHGRPAEFLFVKGGRRLGSARIRWGLRDAATAAGLAGVGGDPLQVTPHQLRHTYATTLVNAGMSLPALMALLGHVTPEMTLRYATLSGTTVRAAYEAAMDKVRGRRSLMVVAAGKAAPDRIEWLRSEMLKTRVAHGYCARHLAAETCPYANICEQCDNFVTTPEFLPALEAQLTDVQALHEDAEARGWDAEVARHARVIASIEGHLRRLKKQPPPALPLDPPARAG